MSVLVASLIGFGCLAFLVLTSLRLQPAALASVARFSVPAALAMAGIFLVVFGRVAIGMPLLLLALPIFRRAALAGRAVRKPGGRSHVRSAALEMELDLDSGDMNGLVLAGSLEGAELDALDEAQLMRLRTELSGDPESLTLLEAYLDRRMPDWRARADADADPGLGAAPSSSAMTEQEAYQILGLGPGAGKPEIREAHRRLMKRMHPDTGGSVFLAGRINEAKDVLMRRHD